MDSQGRLVDLISVLQFHGLSAMESCLLAAHFFVDTLSLTNGTKAIYRGPTIKWMFAFQTAMFLKLLQQHRLPAAIRERASHDEKVLIDLFSKGASRLIILKDSLDVLSSF